MTLPSPPSILSYRELRELGTELAESILPSMITELSMFLGLRSPRPTAKERSSVARRLRKHLESARGYQIAELVSQSQISSAAGLYAAREGQLRLGIKAVGKRIPDSADAFDFVLDELRDQTALPGAFAAFSDGHAAVARFAQDLAQGMSTATLEQANREWIARPEAKQLAQYGLRLRTVMRDWRPTEPRRLTQRLLEQLQREYRSSSSTFELGLRRLVGLAAAARGTSPDWASYYSRPLARILREAAENPLLRPLTNGIRSDVRNAIAHGHWTMAPDRRAIIVQHAGAEIQAWSPSAAWRVARQLTAYGLAMHTFDNHLLLARANRTVALLRAHTTGATRDAVSSEQTGADAVARRESRASDGSLAAEQPVAAGSARPSTDCLECWRSYAADPSARTLSPLLQATSRDGRTGAIAAIEDLYFRTRDWRIAQHVSMLHLDRFEPTTGRSDLVRALFFADAACRLSGQDPRAILALAQVHWQRRLPLAVLYDVDQIIARKETIPDLVPQARVVGEALELRARAYAYLRQPEDAHEALLAAGRTTGRISIEAIARLFVCAWPESPAVVDWASDHLLAHESGLGQRPQARLRHHIRTRFVSLLRTRAPG